MSLSTVHPLYTDMALAWAIVRDCYAGETAVKSKGQEYLPPTQGMLLDGMGVGKIGFKMYEAYKLRAVWHDLFKEAVQAYVGMLWSKPANITLPEGMDGVKSNQGETPLQLLRRINEEQLITSRCGLLVDLPINPNPLKPTPYIALYKAEAVRNWDIAEDVTNQAILNFVILDESGFMRNDTDMFGWNEETRYRVCTKGNLANPTDAGSYTSGLFRVAAGGSDHDSPTFDPTGMTVPMLRGKPLPYIPFTFINSKDNLSMLDEPALLGLAMAMISMYRGEADYRQNLFMQGQDTLVTIGGIKISDSTNPEAPIRTGAGSRIDMEASGDAKYVGVDGHGLPEQRVALAADRARAEVRAGQLVTVKAGDKESGAALKTRLAAQTATLTSIALSGGTALETALKQTAEWMGKDATKVKVEPNEEFSSSLVTGQDMFQLMEAKDLGLPISYESLHAYMVDRGLTRKNFEDEFNTIVAEKERVKVFMNPVVQQQTKDKNKTPPAGPKPGSTTNNPGGQN